ncbi:hypothetical protein SESBI_49632 [Sesbania bispinosa]|nr:hypothetical protein SESBI_49632 [Sesbania bispinosa]
MAAPSRAAISHHRREPPFRHPATARPPSPSILLPQPRPGGLLPPTSSPPCMAASLFLPATSAPHARGGLILSIATPSSRPPFGSRLRRCGQAGQPPCSLSPASLIFPFPNYEP